MSAPEYFENPLSSQDIQRLISEEFGDMVKFVVDVKQRIICVGGGFHSDEEDILLEKGSAQKDLWGANYYPGRAPGEKLVYNSQINIRPRDGNMKQEIQLEQIRQQVKELAEYFFGAV